MKVKAIDFEEDLRPFDAHGHYTDSSELSPAGKVPVLRDGDVTVWESLSILEYLAEKYPHLGLWPQSVQQRAHARSVAHEMHAGFTALRARCPMNMRRSHARLEISDSIQTDVNRIESVWSQCLDDTGGPFLYGDFTIADAMFAPVVNRFQIYKLSSTAAARRYIDTMTALPAWQAWARAARDEPWVLKDDEI